MDKFVQYSRAELKHLDYSPVAFVTAKDGKNVQAVLDLSQHLFKQSQERVTTGILNRAVKQIFEERTPTHKSGKRVKVFYATQIDVAPPTIALIVNNPSLVDDNYQRFMINRFRELLPYSEVPIKLHIRARTRGGEEPKEQITDSPAPLKKPAKPTRGVRRRNRSR
jgi:GTP-binding protein